VNKDVAALSDRTLISIIIQKGSTIVGGSAVPIRADHAQLDLQQE
jgi:hypothetical protein